MNTSSWLAGGARPHSPGSPLNVPPIPVSTFVHGAGREYARDHGTPTWEALEELIGRLEKGIAVSFSSGMAAAASVFDQLRTGSLVVIPDDCYQGVVELARTGEAKGRWHVERLAAEDTDAWVEACARADLVWLESVTNPLLFVMDVEAICATPRKAGAILAVDNTLATPLNIRPLELGADICVHSATKAIGGHSDLLAGIAVAGSGKVADALRTYRELAGCTPGTLEAFLAVRGARTLSLRLERAQSSAMLLAARLESHPAVMTTRYPGLASHATHATARRNLDGYGTIISFDVHGGAAAADDCCACLELIRNATSFGAVESTIERRAAVPGQEHLPPGLLRLSVGIEDPEDLWSDLESALQGARAGTFTP